ncbi:hypothetical protein [Ferribacterium limneticum]|uniref:hypothetical protein n=1 Tax=Ferribacterium limneticum TaxID=76259 RepID=UPI001CF8BB9B|nr:hypothetical protein [Ferribacterium limneticum]UCV22339.1 hypothetical protein KI613_17745 [Ferribacterium limneticum]
MADYPFAPSIGYLKNSHGYRKTLTFSAYVSNLSKNINQLRLPTLVFYTFVGVGNRPEAETQWGGNNCPLSYLNRTNWRRENCSVVFDKNGFNRVNWTNVVPVLTFLF